MRFCAKCGSLLSEQHAGNLCRACESEVHKIGSAEDVPCQRCGMYLPSHELQMWNSRLYCAYCIMDIKDEEERQRKYAEKHSEKWHEQDGALPNEGSAEEACERCGRSAKTLYSVSGRRLCEKCYAESGSPHFGGPKFFAQLVVVAKKVFGGRGAKPVAVQKEGKRLVFDIATRKMVEKK